ncbi:MAG: class I SAM-dependent methyltransferase [Chloroflexota bacterium]
MEFEEKEVRTMDILSQLGLPEPLVQVLMGIAAYTIVMTIIFLVHKYLLGRRVLEWMWYLMGPFSWLMVLRDATRTKKKSVAQLAKYGVTEIGQVVLDYGCGTGSYAISASHVVGDTGKVYAADINPFALYMVRLKARLKGLKNVETILTDKYTGLPEDSVDVVFMSDAFHDFRDKEGIIREMHRVLRPGGHLSISEDLDRKIPKAIAQIEKTNLFSLSHRESKLCIFNKSE